MLTIYGIKQCDTCRRALKWLAAQGVDHRFHDFRVDGLQDDLLNAWLSSSFAEKLVNRRSTTWRQLSEEQKQAAVADLLPLLLEHPTLIKRPVITDGETILDVGFSPAHLDDYI